MTDQCVDPDKNKESVKTITERVAEARKNKQPDSEAFVTGDIVTASPSTKEGK